MIVWEGRDFVHTIIRTAHVKSKKLLDETLMKSTRNIEKHFK